MDVGGPCRVGNLRNNHGTRNSMRNYGIPPEVLKSGERR